MESSQHSTASSSSDKPIPVVVSCHDYAFLPSQLGPPMKSILLLFTVLASACSLRGATILEASLAIPIPMVDGSTASYLGGFAYFRVEEERVSYQIWLSEGTTEMPILSIHSDGHQSRDLALVFLGAQQIHGCELIPRSPYYGVQTWVGGLGISPPESDVPDFAFPTEPPYICHAFSSWDVYEAAITDAHLASLLTKPIGASLTIPTSFPNAQGPNQGTLFLVSVPEPSTLLLSVFAACSLMRRRRQKIIA